MKIIKILICIVLINLLFIILTNVAHASLSGYTVVIDPGHGGSDPGAIGFNNIIVKPSIKHRSFTEDKYTLINNCRVRKGGNVFVVT